MEKHFLNKLLGATVMVLVLVLGTVSYFFLQTHQELENQKLAEQDIDMEDLRGPYGVELKNSIEKSIKIEAMQEVIENHYPQIQEDFDKRYYDIYVKKCKEKELEITNSPLPYLSFFMCQ